MRIHVKTILIADNQIGLSHAMQTVLKNAGYNVMMAQTAEDASRIARAQRPQLIMIADELPSAPLIHLAITLKTSAETSAIPIIVYSDSFRLNFPAYVKRLKADAVLNVPFASATLLEKVAALIAATHSKAI